MTIRYHKPILALSDIEMVSADGCVNNNVCKPLRMSGILAFLAVIAMAATWALVTLTTTGFLDPSRTPGYLGLAYGVLLLFALLVYMAELDR